MSALQEQYLIDPFFIVLGGHNSFRVGDLAQLVKASVMYCRQLGARLHGPGFDSRTRKPPKIKSVQFATRVLYVAWM